MAGENQSEADGAEPTPYPIGLAAQFRKNLHLYAGGGLLLLAQQLLMAKRDFLVRASIDAVDIGASDAAAHAALLLLGVSVGAATARVLSRITMFTGGRNVEYELRAALLSRLHKLGPSFFRKMPTGDIMSRATNDLAQVRLLLGFGVLNVIASVFALISAVYVMLSVSWKLTLAALATTPILMLVTRSFSSKLFTRTRDNQESIGKMSDRVLASLAGVRVVRSFALEESEMKAFEITNLAYQEKSLALARLRGSMGPMMGALSSASVLVVFWYGGHLVLTGEVSKGAFVSFWLALFRLTWPLLALGFVAAIVQRGRAGYGRLKQIFDGVPDIVDGPLPEPAKVRGALRVSHLTFEYGKRKVVDDVSFEVAAGGSLAIVGRTGSGKSTIATLLARLLPTPKGAVLLDGNDICDLPLRTVRASIGYAQQDAFLFSTTVARNVGFALEDADAPEAMDHVRRAATEASVLEEIEGLPEGFDTVVGERGVQLSGGQRQRVALARALLREPPVLVLDDPLSAVDAKTESAILEAIDRQAENRTLLLITHRVAAARRCERILVLDGGRVVEEGTHEELCGGGGLYASFAEEQQIEQVLEALGAMDFGSDATPSPLANEGAA
jgi:ATP-binding cassette subfamily B multidrug efflux pump